MVPVSNISKLRSALLAAMVAVMIWFFAEGEITLRLKSTADTLHVPTVPVWFSMPPTEDAGKWIVELQDKSITDVTLSGPADGLQRIRSGQWPVKAMIELTSDDLAAGILSKPAIFPDLPPGVTATASSQIVRLTKISKREQK